MRNPHEFNPDFVYCGGDRVVISRIITVKNHENTTIVQKPPQVSFPALILLAPIIVSTIETIIDSIRATVNSATAIF